ncbi:MAG: hypothetical protein ACM3PP_00070 [Candidatus Saccharibacteria bacterium]
MVYHIINQSELQKAIMDQVEYCLGRSEGIASYNHRHRRWIVDQDALDVLRRQVRDYLVDYLTDLLEETLDCSMAPDELIGEFYDWEPEPEPWRAGRSGPAWRYDDEAADHEYCRRRDEGLL